MPYFMSVHQKKYQNMKEENKNQTYFDFTTRRITVNKTAKMIMESRTAKMMAVGKSSC